MAKKFTPLFQNPGKTHITVEVYGVKSAENQKKMQFQKIRKKQKDGRKNGLQRIGRIWYNCN
jgi:hypothetical protein